MALAVNDVLETIREGVAEYEEAQQCADPMQRHTAMRLACGRLSQAASDAYMIYSSKPKNNVFSDGGLSTWAREELAVFTQILGSQYYQQGLTDTARMEREFEKWVERVRVFVDKLNRDFQMDSSKVNAKDWKEDEIKRKQKILEDFNRSMMGESGVIGA